MSLKHRTIFAHLPLDMGFARRIFAGTFAEALKHPDWDIFTDSRGAFDYYVRTGSQVGAVISFSPDEKRAGQVLAFAGVALNVSNRLPPSALTCSVINDDFQIGVMAARHFLEHGHRVMYFCTRMDSQFALERWEGFQGEALHAGAIAKRLSEEDLSFLAPQPEPPVGMEFPIALFAENDFLALRLLRSLKRAGWNVPGDVSLLGVDDDELLVATSSPPISSIRPAATSIGAMAAQLIVEGRARRGLIIRIPPEGVTSRITTSLFAIEDPRLRKAIATLEDSFRNTIDYDAVARFSGMGRRNFQQLFRKKFGTTPARWIERRRLLEAKRLLLGTNLSQEEIALQCGFGALINFWRTFHRQEGIAPGTYRERKKPYSDFRSMDQTGLNQT